MKEKILSGDDNLKQLIDYKLLYKYDLIERRECDKDEILLYLKSPDSIPVDVIKETIVDKEHNDTHTKFFHYYSDINTTAELLSLSIASQQLISQSILNKTHSWVKGFGVFFIIMLCVIFVFMMF